MILRAIVAAALGAVLFSMPITSVAAGQTSCSDASCGSGGGGTTLPPGCNDTSQYDSSGDVQSFDAVDDPEPDYSDVTMTYSVPDPGSWNVSYSWQVVDSDGTTIESGQNDDSFSVPYDGNSYNAVAKLLVPRPPVGGAVYVNVYGVNDWMQPLSGEGDNRNYDCSIVF